MSNSNRILIGILTFMVVCVVGYALFSDNITVTGTASTDGNFDVEVSCQTGFVSELKVAAENSESGWGFYPEGGYEDDKCIVNGNNVDFSVNLKYPSAARYFTVTLTNKGSIDAVINMDEAFDGIFKNQVISIYDIKTNALVISGSYKDNYDEWVLASDQYAHFTDSRWYDEGGLYFGKNKSGVISVSSVSGDFAKNGMYVYDTVEEIPYVRMKTGESVSFIIDAKWDKAATDKSRYSVVTTSAEISVQQITADMVEYTGE